MAGIDIISDSTGKEIVAAIQSTDVAQARILEINTAAEAKKNEVLESIPEDYSNISKEVDELKGDIDNQNAKHQTIMRNVNWTGEYYWYQNGVRRPDNEWISSIKYDVEEVSKVIIKYINPTLYYDVYCGYLL